MRKSKIIPNYELETPVTTKKSHSFESEVGIFCGASGMQGWRATMEDAHIVTDIPGQKDHLLLAVFDGHLGSEASIFAAANLVDTLAATAQWKEYVEGGCEDVQRLSDAMITTFIEVDVKMKSQIKDTSGCTAVTCIITPKYILCANAGDSRCVMGTESGAKALSKDHKPDDATERKRIEAAGGFVLWGRVDRGLAMSRALGDFEYKNRPDLPPKEQKVTCYPEITIHERLPTDDLVLLACDGLWDFMSNKKAVRLVREIYESGESDAVKIAEEIIDTALRIGSDDNISAVVARLPGAVVGPAEGGGVERHRLKQLAAKVAKAASQHWLSGMY